MAWIYSEEHLSYTLYSTREPNHIVYSKSRCFIQVIKSFIEDLSKRYYKGIPYAINREEEVFLLKGIELSFSSI